MKWIKASERLPGMQKQMYFKHTESDIRYLGNFDRNEEGVWLYIQANNSHEGWQVEDIGVNFSHWEYLDEYTPVDEDGLWEEMITAFNDRGLLEVWPNEESKSWLKSQFSITRKQE